MFLRRTTRLDRVRSTLKGVLGPWVAVRVGDATTCRSFGSPVLPFTGVRYANYGAYCDDQCDADEQADSVL